MLLEHYVTSSIVASLCAHIKHLLLAECDITYTLDINLNLVPA